MERISSRTPSWWTWSLAQLRILWNLLPRMKRLRELCRRTISHGLRNWIRRFLSLSIAWKWNRNQELEVSLSPKSLYKRYQGLELSRAPTTLSPTASRVSSWKNSIELAFSQPGIISLVMAPDPTAIRLELWGLLGSVCSESGINQEVSQSGQNKLLSTNWTISSWCQSSRVLWILVYAWTSGP